MGGFLLAPSILEAEPEHKRLLYVSGSAEVRLRLPIVELRFLLTARSKSAADAQEEIERKRSVLIDLLKSKKAEAVEAGGIRMWPGAVDSKFSAEATAGEFVASEFIDCRLVAGREGAVLDEALRQRGVRIEDIRPVPDPGELKKNREEVLRQAVLDARSRAVTALSALGLKPEEIMAVHVENLLEEGPENRDSKGNADRGRSLILVARVRLEVRY